MHKKRLVDALRLDLFGERTVFPQTL